METAIKRNPRQRYYIFLKTITQSSRYCKFKYIDDKPLGVFQNFKYNILFKHKNSLVVTLTSSNKALTGYYCLTNLMSPGDFLLSISSHSTFS